MFNYLKKCLAAELLSINFEGLITMRVFSQDCASVWLNELKLFYDYMVTFSPVGLTITAEAGIKQSIDTVIL